MNIIADSKKAAQPPKADEVVDEKVLSKGPEIDPEVVKASKKRDAEANKALKGE